MSRYPERKKNAFKQISQTRRHKLKSARLYDMNYKQIYLHIWLIKAKKNLNECKRAILLRQQIV